MKNLSQLRAIQALQAAQSTEYKGVNEGDVVKKIPAMILQNGILGALAFAKQKGGGHEGVFLSVISHLKKLGRIPDRIGTLDDFIAHLCHADAATLRGITDESMAYLSYLRRFAGKGERDEHDRD